MSLHAASEVCPSDRVEAPLRTNNKSARQDPKMINCSSQQLIVGLLEAMLLDKHSILIQATYFRSTFLGALRGESGDISLLDDMLLR